MSGGAAAHQSSLSLCSLPSVLQTQKHCKHSVDRFPLFTSFHFYFVGHGREEWVLLYTDKPPVVRTMYLFHCIVSSNILSVASSKFTRTVEVLLDEPLYDTD